MTKIDVQMSVVVG